MNNNNAPILFIIFNRPQKTREVFEEIRKARPSRLFIAADGPRSSCPDDTERCKEARIVTEHIDWPCEVRRKYSDENLGCDVSVPNAISWFFESVEQGLIFEDDCLPQKDFFQFCRELLEKYKDESKIMMISGNNFQNGQERSAASYYFSRYANTWGWATWKRAWKHYENDLKSYEKFKKNGGLQKILISQIARNYWRNFFEKIRNGKYSFWDAKWTFSIWNNDGMAIVPNRNLVTNIGQDEFATHTKKTNKRTVVPNKELDWPLIHPTKIIANDMADDYIFRNIYYVSPLRRILNKLSSLI